MAEAIRDNPARQRYELDTPGGLAFIDYQRSGRVVTMMHAEVPPAVRGRGFGARLVRGALDLARGRGETVIPRCPFVASYLRRHPDVQNLVAEPR